MTWLAHTWRDHQTLWWLGILGDLEWLDSFKDDLLVLEQTLRMFCGQAGICGIEHQGVHWKTNQCLGPRFKMPEQLVRWYSAAVWIAGTLMHWYECRVPCLCRQKTLPYWYEWRQGTVMQWWYCRLIWAFNSWVSRQGHWAELYTVDISFFSKTHTEISHLSEIDFKGKGRNKM